MLKEEDGKIMKKRPQTKEEHKKKLEDKHNKKYKEHERLKIYHLIAKEFGSLQPNPYTDKEVAEKIFLEEEKEKKRR